LLEKQNPRAARKAEVDTDRLPPIARPAVLAMDVEIVPEYTEKSAQPKAKRKRNRKKGDKAERPSETIGTGTAAETAEDDEPSSKRRG
jgi:hypothetical protein